MPINFFSPCGDAVAVVVLIPNIGSNFFDNRQSSELNKTKMEFTIIDNNSNNNIMSGTKCRKNL